MIAVLAQHTIGAGLFAASAVGVALTIMDRRRSR